MPRSAPSPLNSGRSTLHGGAAATPWSRALGLLVVLSMLAYGLLPDSPLAAAAPTRAPQVAAGLPTPAATSPPASPPSPTTSSPDASTTASSSDTPAVLRPGPVTLDASGWWSWALRDSRTGKIHGSANMAETNSTASLIKSWIAADYLRRSAEQGQQPSGEWLDQVRVMIRDSDNAAAYALFDQIGGTASIERLIGICGLTDSRPAADGGWSRTQLSARDITRLGACIADGRAAGPQWTDWLLGEMRAVRGDGDFGIRKAFPPATQSSIAIKNGWVERPAEQSTDVNCLAIGDGWTMGVTLHYPIELGYDYGMQNCQRIAEQLLPR